MNEERIFKKNKRDNTLLKKGYLLAILFSMIVAARVIFKRHTFYKGEILYHRDHKGLLISGIVMLIGTLVVTLLLARWYYKMKDKQNEFLKRKYWP